MTVSPYWYLATPYSQYEAGIEAAFRDAAGAASLLTRAGFNVFSPITHSHPIAVYGNINPLDHDVWMAFDKPFVDNASGLIVVKMQGWYESYGVGEEIKAFEAAGKPVLYMEWDNESA